jgi:hypothetical protein
MKEGAPVLAICSLGEGQRSGVKTLETKARRIPKRRSAFEIILLQLHNKAIRGSTRALNVLTKTNPQIG